MFGFKKKSANNNPEYATMGDGCSYINVNTDTSPTALLKHNKNYVYACIQKITQYISSVPIHTYYYTDNPKSLITTNKAVAKYIKKAMPVDAIMRNKGMNMVEIEDIDHPLNQLLLNPAVGYSYGEWMTVIVSYVLTMGNALLEIVEENDKIVELRPLKWEYIYPLVENGKIKVYQYRPVNETPREFTPDQVIHIMDRGAGNTILGKGNLEACIDSSALYSYFDAYQETLAKNYGMPGTVVNVANKIANKDEAQKIAEDYIRKFGRSNTGRPMITFGDVEIKPLSTTPKEMEYKSGREWALKTICACFGVPEDLVSTDDSNRASSTTAIAQFIQITVYPLLTNILSKINKEVVAKYYDDRAYYHYDPQEILEKDQAQQAVVLTSYVDAGIISVNEARNILELPPIEEIKETEKQEKPHERGDEAASSPRSNSEEDN